MNYNVLLEKFKQFARDHKQIECFGYGNISDIEVPVDPQTGNPINRAYPYIFFNPTSHTWGAHEITYRFNVIVMELTTEHTPTGFSGLNSVITAQSNSLKIIGDFLAWIEYDLQEDLVRNTSITPFQERFQDTVAGMTATVEFVMKKGLDFCVVPIVPKPTPQPTPTPEPTPLDPAFIIEVNTTVEEEGSEFNFGGSTFDEEGNEVISEENSFTLPTSGSGYDFSVDWGDGIVETYSDEPGNIVHVYETGGIYDISITGEFPTIRFEFGGDRNKLQKIKNWGTIQWSSFANAFQGCTNLQITATDAPNLTAVTNTEFMFADCLHPDFGTAHNFNAWNTSNVTDMSYMFSNAESFDQPIGDWDVSTVTDMTAMFYGTAAFNQPLNLWNTTNVTDMGDMFNRATAFNQPLNLWDTSNVTRMNHMFDSAATFNQDISTWCVELITEEPSNFNVEGILDPLFYPVWGAPCL